MFSVRALTNCMRSGAIRCSSIPKRGLDEFFPVQSITEKNARSTANEKSSEAKGVPATVGTERVKVGGDWKAWMLRLKSSDDLHKLWYVLLKERNALLTERAICRSKNIPFPDPTRRKKVQKSMARIKVVLHERSQIYKSNQAEIANNKTTND